MGKVPVVSSGHPGLGFDPHLSNPEGSSRQPAGCRITGRRTRSATPRTDHESTLDRQRMSPPCLTIVGRLMDWTAVRVEVAIRS